MVLFSIYSNVNFRSIFLVLLLLIGVFKRIKDTRPSVSVACIVHRLSQVYRRHRLSAYVRELLSHNCDQLLYWIIKIAHQASWRKLKAITSAVQLRYFHVKQFSVKQAVGDFVISISVAPCGSEGCFEFRDFMRVIKRGAKKKACRFWKRVISQKTSANWK